jgi:hypothetical protein
VREDPDREGLLYAGTEFGTFISFDNGGTWQSFQQNLPATVISDRKVYRKDLILATQGRGFWIVDNLTPLHQLTDDIAAARVHLCTPRTILRGSAAPGQLDYYLSEPVQGSLTLEILDEAGNVIRSFESGNAAARPNAPSGSGMPGAQSGRFGGPNAARGLSADAGLNRFEWDLRGGGTGRGGPVVPPGRYTARLVVPGAQPLTAPVLVALDPRLAADGITVEDLRAQYELATRVSQLMADVQQMQSDLRAARERFAGNAAALERIAAIEGRVVTRSGQAYPQPMLAAQASYLNGIVSGGDNRPHRDAYERYEELRVQLDRLRAELGSVTTGR